MHVFAFALVFSDFFIIAAIVATLASSSAIASSSQKSHSKLIRQLDRKVDAIIQHLKIELPDEFVNFGMSKEVCRLADEGEKIPAIKLYRDETGAGLKEAKQAIEAYMEGLS